MKIANKEQLCALPKGTLFIEYKPCHTIGNPYIKTDYYESEVDRHFNHCMDIIPWFKYLLEQPLTHQPNKGIEYESTILITDTTGNEYPDDTLFIVFNKDDIRKMINALMYCLSDAEIDTFTDCEIL